MRLGALLWTGILKVQLTQKIQMLSHLFTFMLTESRMKIHRSQTISGASQQNSVAAFSQTTEADGDLLKNVKEKKHNNNEQTTQNGFIQLTRMESGVHLQKLKD